MKETNTTKRTAASRNWRHTSSAGNVPVGEWVAGVENRSRGANRKDTNRKVRTIGTYGIVRNPEVVINQLRRGKEVRFVGEDGKDWLRLYPCLNTDMTEMFVAAQTMGDFRHSIADIPFNILKRGKIDDVGEQRKAREERTKRIDEARRLSVTPAKVVTCPKCGTEIRVGKELK